jgi:hypothetical protein
MQISREQLYQIVLEEYAKEEAGVSETCAAEEEPLEPLEPAETIELEDILITIEEQMESIEHEHAMQREREAHNVKVWTAEGVEDAVMFEEWMEALTELTQAGVYKGAYNDYWERAGFLDMHPGSEEVWKMLPDEVNYYDAWYDSQGSKEKALDYAFDEVLPRMAESAQDAIEYYRDV